MSTEKISIASDLYELLSILRKKKMMQTGEFVPYTEVIDDVFEQYGLDEEFYDSEDE